MTAALKINPISVEEYLAGEANATTKHEYFGGRVFAMAGASNRHNRLASRLLILLGGKLQGKPCEAFNSDTKVRVDFASKIRFYYPDVVVVCDQNRDMDHFQERPVLIAEVASPSTQRIDSGEKLEAYTSMPSLRDYLLVDTERPHVVVHHRVGPDFTASAYEGPDAVIPLPHLGIELQLSDLYQNIAFDSESPQD